MTQPQPQDDNNIVTVLGPGVVGPDGVLRPPPLPDELIPPPGGSTSLTK